eukprot:CAMPEP_0175953456 /NCGR_PEP_ID=MMETSP0108-20121206/31360_1 /TAXON_ID=195067 ORGANISM="Goniomonas pacifica, Strain CCMP1869" /NCGR_SAMPLE_ID=MMETSP0108 /ASSEMBLY_ACC=CAM_ASM_000204 /LENGTH=288 /DNA_ID=CAMNT_0017280017 /DNA_START=10 /DNA_END=873 /DNA_ORIENTATION=-
MGASYVDSLVADPVVAPPEFAPFYTEKLFLLPHNYQMNNHKGYWKRVKSQEASLAPARKLVRENFGIPTSGPVFCNFNLLYKVDPVCFDSWLAVLSENPSASLLLLKHDPAAAANLVSLAERRNMADRITLVDRISPPANFSGLIGAFCDVTLDTRVYNGHTTTLDSLYAGLGVVTAPEEKLVSRVAASAAIAAGMDRLVARNQKDFIRLASATSHNPDTMDGIRRDLVTQGRKSPLFDTAAWIAAYERGLFMSVEVAEEGVQAHLRVTRWDSSPEQEDEAVKAAERP